MASASALMQFGELSLLSNLLAPTGTLAILQSVSQAQRDSSCQHLLTIHVRDHSHPAITSKTFYPAATPTIHCPLLHPIILSNAMLWNKSELANQDMYLVYSSVFLELDLGHEPVHAPCSQKATIFVILLTRKHGLGLESLV